MLTVVEGIVLTPVYNSLASDVFPERQRQVAGYGLASELMTVSIYFSSGWTTQTLQPSIACLQNTVAAGKIKITRST